jgi:hypothetical protein
LQGTNYTVEALAHLTTALEQHYGPQLGGQQQGGQQGQQQAQQQRGQLSGPLPTLEQFTAQVRRLKKKSVQEIWCEMLVAQPG